MALLTETRLPQEGMALGLASPPHAWILRYTCVLCLRPRASRHHQGRGFLPLRNLTARFVAGAGNRIASVKQLEPLQHLRSLHHLDLEGNPLADRPTYREEVFEMLAVLPHLATVDEHNKAGALPPQVQPGPWGEGSLARSSSFRAAPIGRDQQCPTSRARPG